MGGAGSAGANLASGSDWDGKGDIVIAKAGEVLVKQFPELGGWIAIRVPEEKSRRVGQAVAAASLPEVSRARK
jgi:hypothetical protein